MLEEREGECFFACLWIAGLNQVGQSLLGHHLLHFGQEFLAFGALLGREMLVAEEGQLLAAHQPTPHQVSQRYSRAIMFGFAEPPFS